jgi:hypothetical protein
MSVSRYCEPLLARAGEHLGHGVAAIAGVRWRARDVALSGLNARQLDEVQLESTFRDERSLPQAPTLDALTVSPHFPVTVQAMRYAEVLLAVSD